MNPNSFIAEESVKSFIGRNAFVKQYQEDGTGSLDLFLSFLREKYNFHEIDVYSGDNFYAQMFTLPDLIPAVVYFDKLFLNRISVLLVAMTRFDNTDVNRKLVRSLALKYVSDYLVASRNVELAFGVLLEEFKTTDVNAGFEMGIVDVQELSKGEYHLVIWHFTLAHEFGHLLASKEDLRTKYDFLVNKKNVRHILNQAVLSHRNRVLNKAIDENNLDEEKAVRISEYYASFELSADLDALEDEVLADLAAVDILIQFSSHYRSSLKIEKFNNDRFVCHIFSIFLGLKFINNCKFLSSRLAVQVNDKNRLTPENSILYTARYWFVVNFYASKYRDQNARDWIIKYGIEMEQIYLDIAQTQLVDVSAALNANLGDNLQNCASLMTELFKEPPTNFIKRLELTRFTNLVQQFDPDDITLQYITSLAPPPLPPYEPISPQENQEIEL